MDHCVGASEMLDRQDVHAWQVGQRLVLAYELTSDPFPEAPAMACMAHTHLDITFPRLDVHPDTIRIYPTRLTYFSEEDVAVTPE